MHFTLPYLRALDARHPTERKLLLVPSINFGRELLAALAHERGSWIGWEAATLATLAEKLAVVELAKKGLRRGSDVAVADAINAAFSKCIARKRVHPALAELAWSAGTRTAVVDAVLELRMAGVTPQQLVAVGGSDTVGSLARVLVAYEGVLKARGLADAARVFNAALEGFSSQAPFVLDHTLLVTTPGWAVRGIPRLLLEQLVERGLRLLPIWNEVGAVAPEALVDHMVPSVAVVPQVTTAPANLSIFSAVTPQDEIRTVLREAVASGHGLDDIEIACTDTDTYGIILEALSEHIGIRSTFLDGIPLESTRIGRALSRWLMWVESDYTAAHVRAALESGDWEPGNVAGETSPVPTGLVVAELRRMRIGWGIPATRRAIARLRMAEAPSRFQLQPDEGPDVAERRRAGRRTAREALARLLEFLVLHAPVHASPGLPPAARPATGAALGVGAAEGVSVASLARHTLEVLQLVQPSGTAEETTLQRLRERLADVALLDGEHIPVQQALGALRQELADLRAWTDTSGTPRPRRATGGHIHLTGLECAGATGRPLLFLVGLDAERTAGPVVQSPLLPDSLRARLSDRGASLATTEIRRRERAWQLAAAIGGSSARISLSYAIRGGTRGRDASPAPALLHVARALQGKPQMGYDDLRSLLGSPAHAVPPALSGALDARDVWLASMSGGPLLLNAEQAARALFPGLHRGLAARTERGGETMGAHHGLVPGAAVLDPRNSRQPISPSALEMMASCSMRWFYDTALNARTPEEPVYDPLVWLNPLDRGSALHTIYERLVRDRLYEQPAGATRNACVADIVHTVASEMEQQVPAPGAAVRARELEALHNDARLFVSSEHDAFVAAPWDVVALESSFGGEQPATLPLDDGTELLVHGRVDRVDRLRDGTLRLVDYKTGRAFGFDARRGTFEGGRKLQLAVYSPAISAMLNGTVSVAEYRFPTAKGDGEVARADSAMLAAAPGIVRSLLDDVAAGRFAPTIDKTDCTYCEFAAICRATAKGYTRESPRAEWAKLHADNNPHFAGVLSRARRAGTE